MKRSTAMIPAAILLALTLAGGSEARKLEGLLTSWECSPHKPYDLAVLRNGSVWLAIDDKILALDRSDGTFVTYTAPLPAPVPDFIMVNPDEQSILWLTDAEGQRIVRFDPTTHVFTAWEIPHPQFKTLSPPFSVTPGPNGDIWFTTLYDDYAIGRLNPHTGIFQRYEPPGGTSRGMPVEIAFDASGIAWFTLDIHYGNPGLGRLDPDTGAFTTWPNPYAGAMTPFGIVVVQDIIWFADHGRSSIVRFDPTTEIFSVFPAPVTLLDFHFLTLGLDGRLYTAALGTGSVGAFDIATGQYEVRTLFNPNSQPMGVTTASTGQIWIAEDSHVGSDYGGVARLTPFGPAALAVGVPGEDINSVETSGAANVIFGYTEGLSGTGGEMWHQDIPGVEDFAEEFDRFGYSLASGDFNGDGRMDLAVGVPTEGIGTAENAGAVQILYGTFFGGLISIGDQHLHQASPGIHGIAEAGDQFAWSLTSGDYNGDGFSDLVIGVPFEDVLTIGNAGCVNVIYGSPAGLHETDNEIFHQDISGIDGVAEAHDKFGISLASGDFDRNGYDDLVVGVPWESVGSLEEAGIVQVIPGSANGLTATGDRLWSQDTPYVLGVVEAGDRFGTGLAVGDFDGDGWDDLAIGSRGEEINDVVQAGAVNVLYGSSDGLSAAYDDFWHQDVTGILDQAEAGDSFGQALAAADFDGDGYDDLAIGVPFENLPGVTWAGAVAILYGTSIGLTASGDQFWHQDSPGIDSTAAEYWDKFGFRVAAADFDFDGYDDLAVGVPEEDMGTVVDAGAVNVLYGSETGITTDRDQLWHQHQVGVADVPDEDDKFGYAIRPLHLNRWHLVIMYIFHDGFESGDFSGWSSWTP